MVKFRYRVAKPFENELEALCEYADVVEGALAQIIKRRHAEIDQWVSEIPEESIHFYGEDIDNARRRFTHVFPQVFRHSLFVACYSLFEYCFAEECNYHPKPPGGPHKPKSIKIHDTMQFLKQENEAIFREEGQEFNELFTDQTQEWGDIRFYNKLRNCIVHNSGQASGEFLRKHKNFIDRHSSQISISEQGYIRLSRNFVVEFAQTLRSFFQRLHNVRSLLYTEG